MENDGLEFGHQGWVGVLLGDCVRGEGVEGAGGLRVQAAGVLDGEWHHLTAYRVRFPIAARRAARPGSVVLRASSATSVVAMLAMTTSYIVVSLSSCVMTSMRARTVWPVGWAAVGA